MQVVRRLDGNQSFNVLDLKLSATVVAGQLALASTAANSGGYVGDPTTTSLADVAGFVNGATPRSPEDGRAGSLTYSTTQGDPEGLVELIINPDAIFSARASGSGTSGTSLTVYAQDTASAGGTVLTDADLPTGTFDEGVIWCISGNNVGQARRITAYTANASLTVTSPFVRALAVGDTFLIVPWTPFVGTALQLTADFLEADASIAVGTGANARAVELILQGRADSSVYFIARDHALNELS